MIAYNLRVFGLSLGVGDEGGSEEGLNKLKTWNMTQIGLLSMIKFQAQMKKIAEWIL